MMKPIPACLRCKGVDLRRSDLSSHEIEFFDCPQCYRSYARMRGGPLTFRWLHPISLPLYCLLSYREPPRRASDVAEEIASGRSEERMSRMVDEIELELDHPTQNVRDILDNPQTEDECRAFLRDFVASVRARLGRPRS